MSGASPVCRNAFPRERLSRAGPENASRTRLGLRRTPSARRTLTKLSGCVFIGLGRSAALVDTASHVWSAPDQDLGMDGIGPSSSMPCSAAMASTGSMPTSPEAANSAAACRKPSIGGPGA
jgi:hypothetical protein